MRKACPAGSPRRSEVHTAAVLASSSTAGTSGRNRTPRKANSLADFSGDGRDDTRRESEHEGDDKGLLDPRRQHFRGKRPRIGAQGDQTAHQADALRSGEESRPSDHQQRDEDERLEHDGHERDGCQPDGERNGRSVGGQLRPSPERQGHNRRGRRERGQDVSRGTDDDGADPSTGLESDMPDPQTQREQEGDQHQP